MDKMVKKTLRKAISYMYEAYYWSESREGACKYVSHVYPEIDLIVLETMWEVIDTGVEMIAQ